MAGVTPAGWVPKTLSQIQTDLQNNIQANVQAITNSGEQVNVSSTSLVGQFIGAVSEQLTELWEAGTAVYNNGYAGSASGVCKEQACQLVGVFALGQSFSETTLSISGDEGTPVGAGFTASNASGQFSTLADTTITKTNADRVRIQIGNVSIGNVFTVTVAGIPFSFTATAPTASNVQSALIAAISAGSLVAVAQAVAGDTTNSLLDVFALSNPINVSVSTNLTIIDRAAQAPAQASVVGPVDVTQGTITNIVTPLNGVTACTNRFEGTQGQITESPTALEARRKSAVRGVGSGSPNALAAKLPQMVQGILSVNIIQNRGNSTDGAGRPAHSYECVVIGASDQAVAQGIWSFGPAGIPTAGNKTITVTDASGNPQTVKFSRTTQVYIWVKVTITEYDPGVAFPTDGVSQIQVAVAAFGATIKAGGQIANQRTASSAFKCPGISQCTVQIATSSLPAGPPGGYSGADLQLTAEQQAYFDPSRVFVQT